MLFASWTILTVTNKCLG